MRIGSKEVEVAKALPLTIGDWKKLEAQGLSPMRMADKPSISEIAALVHYVVAKVDGSVTVDDVDSLTFTELAEAFSEIGRLEGGKVNRPT